MGSLAYLEPNELTVAQVGYVGANLRSQAHRCRKFIPRSVEFVDHTIDR